MSYGQQIDFNIKKYLEDVDNPEAAKIGENMWKMINECTEELLSGIYKTIRDGTRKEEIIFGTDKYDEIMRVFNAVEKSCWDLGNNILIEIVSKHWEKKK